ncbi:MAG: hypothetical protein NWE76_10890 [Candidatus Bathyarchaeota archaeon]|nr:hypothetical protein [Candidatus Bathyarchaeota archaeon]
MAANKPPQYNPMMMQLAQQMMQAGQQRPMTYGRTDGLAAGLTSAGNSLVGALMMKPQMKAYQAQQEELQKMYKSIGKYLGFEEEGGKPPSESAQKLAATLSTIPGMNISLPKQAAGAPSGRKAAPAAKAQQPMTGGMPPQMKKIIGAMMASGNPEMQSTALQLAVSNIERPMSWKERIVPIGGNHYLDAATGAIKSLDDQAANWKELIDMPDYKIVQPPGGGAIILEKGPGKAKIMGFPNEQKSQEKGVSWEEAWWVDEDNRQLNPVTDPRTGEPMLYGIKPLAMAGTEAFPGVSKTEEARLDEQIRKNKDSIAVFDAIEKAYTSKSFLTTGGQAWFGFTNLVERLGFPIPDDWKKKQAGFSQFYAGSKGAINTYIVNLSGAQVSAQEATRLMAALPNPDSDGETRFLAKLKLVRTTAEAAVKRYDEVRYGERKSHEEAQRAADRVVQEMLLDPQLPDVKETPLSELYKDNTGLSEKELLELGATKNPDGTWSFK